MKAWLSVIIPVAIEIIGVLLAYLIVNHFELIPIRGIAIYFLGQNFLLLIIVVIWLFDNRR